MDRQSVDVAGVSAGAPARLSTWPTQRLAGWTAHLSRLQMFVGLTSGLVSITGALYTVPAFFKPAPGTGEIVAIVRDAKTEKAVIDAKVEILTVQNAVITTVIPNDSGKARYSLAEGQYRIRVSHPRFGAEARPVQVVKGRTAEVHVQLRRGASSPLSQAESTVKDAVRTVRRLFSP